jgi:prepilin-type N-terminal cleavage/methylation domain-containing protein
MQKFFKNRAGFTLVEVLVVVVIIAILAAIAVPIYLNYVASARAAEAQEAISAIMAAARVFQSQNGRWPTNITQMRMLTLDPITTNRWNFTIITGGAGISQVTATSTGIMPGGAGKTVTFNAQNGRFTGYGNE